ncbi:MAG TPA: LapA family protein [Myxococcota bacterium]|nr:LapA family protein [Myxococcota bacterium]
MRLSRWLGGSALFVGALVFGWRFRASNETLVPVDFLVGVLPPIPIWKILCATFLLGAAAATLVCLFQLVRLSLTARRYRKALGQLEAEIHELRTLPLRTPGAPDVSAEPSRQAHPVARLEHAPGRGS